jgi:hypothetical protein
MTTTIQQASADKVGPNCTPGVPGTGDQLTQGALGEFYSRKVGTLIGGVSGKEFGEVRSNIAMSDSEVIGANTAYYASGEFHSDREKEACQ